MEHGLNLNNNSSEGYKHYDGFTPDFLLEVARGNVAKHSIVHKFGRNNAVGTTFVPVCQSGFYQVPTAPVALEIVSSNVNDTSAGTGARTIIIEGLKTAADTTEQTEEVTLNGQTPVNLTSTWWRIYRAHVSDTGTYATQTEGSHAGDITIRPQGGGDAWAVIVVNGFPRAQTQIGAFTIPKGYTAHIGINFVQVNSGKLADVLLFKRTNADVIVAPFGAMRMIDEFTGVADQVNFNPKTWSKGIAGPADIGFLAKVSATTGIIAVDFELLMIQD